jgi:DNA-binding MarR family transcriptional regulator
MTRTPQPPQFYKAGSYRAEESVGYLMKRVMLSIVQQADKGLAEHDLTMAQWVPLKHMQMQSSGSCTVAELARHANTDAGAMTRLLDRLEKKGLCKRVRSTEDRRVVQVELTPDGEAALVQVPAVMANVMNQHLAGFSKSEWIALKSYLTRMVENGDALRDQD